MENVTKTPLQKYFEPEIQELVDQMRPEEEEIRKKLDIGFSFEKQNLILFEIRPGWKGHEFDYTKTIHIPFAKARYIKSKSCWYIYWQRANGNWDRYTPHPTVKNVEDFFKVIEDNPYGAFD